MWWYGEVLWGDMEGFLILMAVLGREGAEVMSEVREWMGGG